MPGWLALTKIAVEVAALAAAARLLGFRQPLKKPFAPSPPPSTPSAPPAPSPVPSPPPPATVPPAPPPGVPDFISEVADKGARIFCTAVSNGALYVAMYSDGRVRMATPSGRRFSGFVAGAKAVMADLREDVSFEMILNENADTQLMLTMDGGPFEGRSLICERMS